MWRANNQSIVGDEAASFNYYLNGSWVNLYLQKAPNVHILYSLASKLSLTVLGLSEFALRLPSVVAGLFLMLGIWRILERSPSRLVRWAVYLVFLLNPLLLDFSVVGRGYVLALALLAWSIHFAMQKRWTHAGILLGLSISANFTCAFAAAGLIAATVLVDKSLHPAGRMAALGGVVALALCAPSIPGAWEEIRTVHSTHVPLGHIWLEDSVYDLIVRSIRPSPPAGLFGGATGGRAIQYVFLPVAAMIVFLSGLFTWRKQEDRASLIPALTLVVDVLLVVAARHSIDLWYPLNHYGLHWILLSLLSLGIAAGSIPPGPRLACAVALAALAVQFASQLHANYFAIWFYDASINQVARRLEHEVQGQPPGSVSLSVSEMHQDQMEFYRLRYHISALQPVERVSRAARSGRDYYVWNLPERRRPELLKLTVLYRDDFSGVILAK